MKKRLVCILLCVLLLAALLPLSILASGEDKQLYFITGDHQPFTDPSFPCGDGGPYTFAVSDGSGGYTELDGSWRVWTDNGLGIISWRRDLNSFFWETDQCSPGAQGKVYAQLGDGTVYEMNARLNAPVVGVYLDEAGTQFCVGGKVDYTSGTAKTVWLKTGDGFSFADVPANAPDTLAVEKISDTLVKLTLAAEAAGTFTVRLDCRISVDMDTFSRSCSILFAEPLTEGLYLYDGITYCCMSNVSLRSKTDPFTGDLFRCDAQGSVFRMTEAPADAEISCGGVIASAAPADINGYKTWEFTLTDEGWNGNVGTGTVTLTPTGGKPSTVTFNFTLPAPQFEQLYFLGMNGAESGIGRPYGDMSMWKLAVPGGQDGFIVLDDSWRVWTDPGLGAFLCQGPDGFLWDTNQGVPGTFGFVYAQRNDGPVYRMNANVNAPVVGIYSAVPTQDILENFCPGNTVRYVTGQETVAYLKLGFGAFDGELSSTNRQISASISGDSVAAITLQAGCSGTVSTELSIPTTNGSHRVTVTFMDAGLLFNADFSDQQHPVFSDKLTGFPDSGMPLELYVDRGRGMEPLGQGFTITATRGDIIQPQEPGPAYIWGIPSDTEPGFGTITAVNGSESYRMQVVVGIPQHKATAAEVLPAALEDGLYTDEYKDLNPEKIQPAEFRFEGGTYYMAVGALEGMGPGGPITWGSLNPEDSVTTLGTVGVDFYTFDAGRGFTPVDAALRGQITAAFNGSLCLTMYAEKEDQTYPAMLPSALDYVGARTYVYDGSVRGRMFFTAEGTIGGISLRSLGMFEYLPRHVEEMSCSTVAEVNSYLETELAENAPNAMYKIYLDADELTGTIVVPESYSNADVYIYGKGWSEKGSGSGTKLYGSIDSDAHLFLYGMDLIGKGKTVTEDNAGLIGDDIIQFFCCSFTDYYHAVETVKGLRFGGDRCTFRNNHVGVYLEMNPYYSDGGNPWMSNFLFEGNDIAIQCVRFSVNMPMYEFKITQSSFLENAQDIVNTSGRYLCVPGNYFYHSDWQPNKGKSLNAYSSGNVTIYPVATDPQFKGLDYTIEEEGVVLSNDLAGDYRIPDTVLDGKTLTVIDNDLEDIPLGTWSFGGDAE